MQSRNVCVVIGQWSISWSGDAWVNCCWIIPDLMTLGKAIDCPVPRETREGWPLLIVETEMSRDSKSTNCPSCPSLVGSLGLLCRYKRFLSCLGCASRPSTKYFFLTIHYFHSFCSYCPASWAGKRAGSPVYSTTGLWPCILFSIIKATCPPTTANENEVYAKRCSALFTEHRIARKLMVASKRRNTKREERIVTIKAVEWRGGVGGWGV